MQNWLKQFKNMAWALLFMGLGLQGTHAAELRIGSAGVDITPAQPIALAGNYTTVISDQPATPIVAAALAIEAVQAGRIGEHIIIITCDLVAIRDGVQQRFRQQLGPRLPGVNMRNVLLTATHTHKAPITTEVDEGRYLYEIPKEGVIQPRDYMEFLLERLTTAAIEAWKNRAAARVSWTLGHATVGHNRRVIFADGRAEMHGKSNRPDFRSWEGSEDSGVESLFFWDTAGKLKALAVNLACPAQAMGGKRVDADYWHEAREQLRAKLGEPKVTILGWTSAAGDQTPINQYRAAAEARMTRSRGLNYQQEIGRRVSNAVMDTIEIAKKETHQDVEFAHQVLDLALPPRRILEREYLQSKGNLGGWMQKKDVLSRTMVHREKDILRRYEQASAEPPYKVEVHILRVGDVAIATNPFELFLDYGLQIKGRSPALQTFLIQHAGNAGLYLPTEKAIAGGAYSGLPHTNLVGPEGGRILVDRTVESIQALWARK
jgi:hypothetical protein